MQTIERKYGSERNLEFQIDFTNYYQKYNLDANNIADIIFSVKKSQDDSDNTVFIRKYSSGEITFSQTIDADGNRICTVIVTWPATGYTNFQKNKKYIAGLYPKFSGDTNADENTDSIFNLVILQDHLINN